MNYQLKNKQMAKALYNAFKGDAFYIALERSIEEREAAVQKMQKYFDYSICEAQRYGKAVIPEPEQVGVSLWSTPLPANIEQQRLAEKQAFLKSELGKNSLETYTRIGEFTSAKAESLVGVNSWYLSIVAIQPQYQGRGYGSTLITPVLALADQHEVPTYLETFTPRTQKFYRQLGYREVSSCYEPTVQAEYAIMVRDVNGS